MTAEEVLAVMEVSDDDMSTASSDERSDDDLELDDSSEPIMEGDDLPSVESEEVDEGFPGCLNLCTQTPPATNITITANGPNSTI